MHSMDFRHAHQVYYSLTQHVCTAAVHTGKLTRYLCTLRVAEGISRRRLQAWQQATRRCSPPIDSGRQASLHWGSTLPRKIAARKNAAHINNTAMPRQNCEAQQQQRKQ